jgi:hypothetical protein
VYVTRHHHYVESVQDAATLLIDGISRERRLIEDHQRQRDHRFSEARDFERTAANLLVDPDFDDEGIGTLAHWEAHFGMAEVDRISKEIDARLASLGHHEDAMGALCTALLQIAKQGLSTVHGGEPDPPIGRDVGSQRLTKVIWEARNQAMHFEEDSLRTPVKRCFRSLQADFGDHFSLTLHAKKNLACRVIQLLEWTSFAKFATDLDSVLRNSP